MTRTGTLPSALILLCLIPPTLAQPPRVCGVAANHVAPSDIVEIQQLLHDKGTPWLIESIVALQVSPTLVLVFAFMPPKLASPQLRRGREFVVSKYVGPDPPIPGWTVTPGTFEYAQVRLRTSGQRNGCNFPEGWEEPFRIEGHVADEDIIAVMALIKTGPKNVEGANRILQLDSTGDVSVEVRTESYPGGGQLIKLRKGANGEWAVDEVWSWNA